MLVSAIAQYDAIQLRNNAVMASMQTSENVMSTLSNMHTFAGEQNLELLHRLDNQFSLEMLTNSLRYKMACLQEEMFSKMHKRELENNKKSVNYLA